MALTILDQNDQTASGGVDIPFSSTDDEVFQFEVDLGLMQAGDTVQLSIDIKVVAAGAFIELYGGASMLFSGVQAAPNIIQISRPIPSVHEIRLTLEQTAGVNRVYPWKAMSLGTAVSESTGSINLVNGDPAQSIAIITTNKTLVLLTDHGNMIGGDTVTLRLEERVRTAGTDRVAFSVVLAGAQSDPDIAQISVPIGVPDRGEATAELTAGGTDHAMPYTLMSVAA